MDSYHGGAPEYRTIAGSARQRSEGGSSDVSNMSFSRYIHAVVKLQGLVSDNLCFFLTVALANSQ